MLFVSEAYDAQDPITISNMGNNEGFQSKYERGEHIEIAKASLSELEALERKYSSVLNGSEYAFS